MTMSAGQENLLLDFAQRLDRHRDDRRAVHLHLSRLKPQNRRDHHLRIAVNTLEDFTRAFEGQIFTLGSGDIIFVCKGVRLAQLDDIVMRMRYMFSEDPLASAEPDEEGHGRFATLYNVESQYAQFLEVAKQLFKQENDRQKRLQQIANQSGEGAPIDTRRPLSPQQLGRLEETLERTDLSSVLRRQAICAFGKDEKDPPKPMFRELFVSVMDLAKTVLPDVDLAANRWLFQHLTQTLDRRVLRMLARADDTALHSSISINLNVPTLLSQEFIEFDSSLRMGSRGTLVVELQMIDILADYPNFLFARDFVREKGYRVCLDGVTPDTIAFVDRHKLGIDLIKLASSPALGAEDEDDIRLQEIGDEIARVGKGRVILSRVDNEAMIRNGKKLGVTLFQGRHVDQLMQRGGRNWQPTPADRIRRLSRS